MQLFPLLILVALDNSIELNAVQRSNPEMQKRVANTIRALVETGENPIVSIHDHGAGGHLNCLSELVEETGGTIYINQLPCWRSYPFF